MGIITPDYYIMRPFRMWARACLYLSMGAHVCINNVLSPLTGEPLKYGVSV